MLVLVRAARQVHVGLEVELHPDPVLEDLQPREDPRTQLGLIFKSRGLSPVSGTVPGGGSAAASGALIIP